MEHVDKLVLFNKLYRGNELKAGALYDALDECGALKSDYKDYMTTTPVDCDKYCYVCVMLTTIYAVH